MGFSFSLVTAVAGLGYGIFAAMGCYIDAYGNRDPYPRRGPLLAAMAGGFVAAFLLGSLAAYDTWLTVVTLSFTACAATLFVQTLHLSGPGSYFVVLIAALTAFLPPDPAEIPLKAACLLFGSGCSWLMSMSGWLVRPYGPEEKAVSAAFRAVAAFAGAADGDGTRTSSAVRKAGQSAYTAVHAAWTALDDARGPWRKPSGERRLELYVLLHQLEAVVDAVQDSTAPGRQPVQAAWKQPLLTAAKDITAGRSPEPWPDGPSAGAPAVKSAPTAGRDAASPAIGLWPAPLPPRKSIAAELRQLPSLSSPTPFVALRVGLAVAAGTALGKALPLLHPSWVAVGAAAALQGGTPGRKPTQRARQRLFGTVAGVALTALAFHSYQPGIWATVAVATAVHAASRAVPPRYLFLIMALNTPFALLLADAGDPGTGLGRLAAFRLLDITLGLIAGVATGLVMRGVPLRRVYIASARAVRATGAALSEQLRTGRREPGADGEAWRRLSDLWILYAAVPTEETKSTDTAQRLWPVVLALRRLLSYSITAPNAPPAPATGERIARFTDTLADAALAARPPAGAAPPVLPEHPELGRRLDALGSALEGTHSITALKSPRRRQP